VRSRKGSVTKVFLFVYGRTTWNSLRRLARRLTEPRYGIGFALGLLYFLWIFSGSRGSAGRRGGAAPLSTLPPETLLLALFCSSAALSAAALILWIWPGGKPDLSLSEAEAQFFFAAPLPSRSVVHYALLRPQVALLLSSAVLVLIFRRGPPIARLQAVFGTWIVLSAMRLYSLGTSFAKASWREHARSRRRWIAAAAATGLLALILYSVFDAATVAARAISGREGFSVDALREAVSSRKLGALSDGILLPVRAILAPLFAPTLASFLGRLPVALAILSLVYTWVVLATGRYEEATLEGAARREDRKARHLSGRGLWAPASSGSRAVVAFPLGPVGRPEIAILWKNLLSWHRIRLARLPLGILISAVLLFVLFRLLAAGGVPAAVGFSTAGIVAFTALILGLIFPLVPRYDLRQDLEHLDVLRSWPVTSQRLVAAELATPWLLSVLFFLSGIAFAAAIGLGSLGPKSLPILGMPETISVALPILLAALCLVPTISAFIAIIQNGLTLMFPAWFHQREKRVTSLERTGGGVLVLLVMLLVLLLAALPCAVVAGFLWLVLGRALGLWIVPIAAVFSAALLWGMVLLGVKVLARLYEKLDPATDLGA
jgi:ABC-2 type transport system permease protein